MEKFRSTSDPSTGVHPFLPPTRDQSFLSSILGCALFFVRAPLFLAAFVFYAAVSSLIQLVPIAPVSRTLEAMINFILLPVLGLSLGMWRYSYPLLQRPRARSVSSESWPTSCDIIIVNHCSPLDALYLAFWFSPTFAIPSGANIVELSTVSAFWQVGSACSFQGRSTSVKELMAKKRKPLVVFAEGCTTNGRGVLKFDLLPETLASCGGLYALGLRYSSDRREAYAVGSLAKHLLSLMMSPRCRIVGHLQAVPASNADLQSAVSSLAGVPALRIGREAGVRFSAHWGDHGS